MEMKIPYTATSPDAITADLLQPITYQYHAQREVEIVIRQPEFTAVCPMTGLPDFGTITIIYTPNQQIVELKSLKYYLLQYRTAGIFYEHVVNRIMDDLSSVLKPRRMEVIGDFTARGGITTQVTARYEEGAVS